MAPDDVSAGSHLPASADEWIRTPVGDHVEVQSASGGTGVATALVGGAPILPVRPGELSGPSLGVTLEAWGPAGGPVRGQTAELVITRPMPSMPLHFWNDAGGSRHNDSSFPAYPGVRRHGDWVTMTQRGTVIANSRPDSTLNRPGVRIG
jgi:acyl-coenzyme A synthetase/AMP-(fatty) acid ligase